MRQREELMHTASDAALEVDGWMRIELDDELLAHVALVVFSKLRRNEPLLVSWTDPAGSPAQAWLHPNATIVARHTAGADTTIDRRRAERMMVAANSNWGLRLTTEALEPAPAPAEPVPATMPAEAMAAAS
ncbi:DUF7882 family protein [Agromyces sp. ZXT2-6]|uniref:DUF7882 family protein n=1 Tax=Agromyces sp. ZXT2-6 TaxID=3461153 RepID=UPI004054EA94